MNHDGLMIKTTPIWVTEAAGYALLIVAFLLPTTQPSAFEKSSSTQGSRAEAEAIIEKAKKAYNVKEKGAKPFVLTATFRGDNVLGELLNASLNFHWYAPDRWRMETIVGENTRVRLRDGSKAARYGQGAWGPREATASAGLDSPFNVMSLVKIRDDDKVRTFKHNEGGVPTIDVIIEASKGSISRGFRFNENTGALLRQDTRREFSWIYESRESEGKLIFTTVKYFSKDKQVSQWSLTSFQWLQAQDQALLAIPEGATVWTPCEDDDEMPKLLFQAPVSYPQKAMTKGLSGRVVVSIQIGANGNVEDAHVVESTSNIFDSSALEAIKKFKYAVPDCLKPTAPIDWLVTLNFQPVR